MIMIMICVLYTYIPNDVYLMTCIYIYICIVDCVEG